jgi:small subunit ribosomal protein S5
LEAIGIENVLAKSQGSNNPGNVVRATFDALLRMRDAKSVAEQRGVNLTKVFNG